MLRVSETRTLWRPVGQAELDLIAERDWREFPPCLEGQPIFYPVLNEQYVDRFEVQRVGGRGVEELWVPAAELDEFNRHIVGRIELVGEYR